MPGKDFSLGANPYRERGDDIAPAADTKGLIKPPHIVREVLPPVQMDKFGTGIADFRIMPVKADQPDPKDLHAAESAYFSPLQVDSLMAGQESLFDQESLENCRCGEGQTTAQGDRPLYAKFLAEEEPWQADAACRDKEVDPNLFFPERGESKKAQEAQRICFSCTVRVKCEDFRKRTDSRHGIWAGKEQKRKEP